jgi:hypothetical protein
VYLAGSHELPTGSLDLPWASGREFCVGELAREQGARVPGRLVSSAKSWLCHGGVDRTAAILPWGASDDVARISPVVASTRILAHLREAWDATFADALAAQEVVLTVPASFDEVARELTLAAARDAGLPDVVLLEEPQAAFYAWLRAHERDWRALLASEALVLVVDVGGGTTDLSLIAARTSRGRARLRACRGGRASPPRRRQHRPRPGARRRGAHAAGGGQLDTQRFHGLVSQARAAKERLLNDPSLGELRVTVPGRGGTVVGGALGATIARAEVESIVLDRFFPQVDADARPRRAAGLALREWGLPFAAEPEITRHVAEFLARQREAAGEGERTMVQPDALLWNGGALEPPAVRERLRDVVASWQGGDRPAVLEAQSLQLAVARGAAYFGSSGAGSECASAAAPPVPTISGWATSPQPPSRRASSAWCRAAWRRASRSTSPSTSSSWSPIAPCRSRCTPRPIAWESARGRSSPSRRARSPRFRRSVRSCASGESSPMRPCRSISRCDSPRSARSRSGAARARPTIVGGWSSACAVTRPLPSMRVLRWSSIRSGSRKRPVSSAPHFREATTRSRSRAGSRRPSTPAATPGRSS